MAGSASNLRDPFIEASTARKLKTLQTIFDQYGRVDGRQKCLDIRFDKVTYIDDQESTTPAKPRTSRRQSSNPQ